MARVGFQPRHPLARLPAVPSATGIRDPSLRSRRGRRGRGTTRPAGSDPASSSAQLASLSVGFIPEPGRACACAHVSVWGPGWRLGSESEPPP